MRGDLALRARLLARPRAILGIVTMVAGAAAIAATLVDGLPWYEVRATLDMLGTAQSSVVATLPGWESQPWAWIAPALGVVAIGVGARSAIDRPVRVGGDLELLVGVALAAVAGISALVGPPVARFDAPGTPLREQLAVSGRLPEGVSLAYVVRPGAGIWITLAGGALLVAAGLAGRD